MADILSEVEAIPSAYPTAGDDALWQRIEAWCAHRWTARAVTIVVEGPGLWRPRLAPFAVATVERWDGTGWVSVTLPTAPLGGFLIPAGSVRIGGTAGADNPAPAAVLAAFERLKAYVEAEAGGVPGASSYGITMGQISENFRRSPNWLARALELSGAADLLRPYRRA